jgi:hypothetical protein
MSKDESLLNPMVFVKDENDPKFVAHIERRVKKALSGRGVLSKSEFIKRLNAHIKELKSAEIYHQV